MGEEKQENKNDKVNSNKNALKHTGPHLEVTLPKTGEKKVQSKKMVIGKVEEVTEPIVEETPHTKSEVDTTKYDTEDLNNSIIVCSRIADKLDVNEIKSIAKQHGVDLVSPEVKKQQAKELRNRIRAWKKCPCRLDFRNVCRDPATGRSCPVVEAYMTPQRHDPTILQLSSKLPPGTIGISRAEVAFHVGGNLPSTNDPYALGLGRREDGTMCVTVQYAPELPQPPEYFCTTVRQTQADEMNVNAKRLTKTKSGKNPPKGKKNPPKGKKKK